MHFHERWHGHHTSAGYPLHLSATSLPLIYNTNIMVMNEVGRILKFCVVIIFKKCPVFVRLLCVRSLALQLTLMKLVY
jgi:hypothetical protein